MKSKKSWGIAIAVIIIAYFLVGYFMLSFSGNKDAGKSQNSELNNDEGQEFAKQMGETGQDAREEGQVICKQLKEGRLNRTELIGKLESSKTYLQNNLKNVNPENVNYIELLYNTAFLIGFSQNYSESDAETQKQIEKHNLIRIASDAHDYIVNTLYEPYDETTETELIEKLEDINEEELERLADLMIQ